jgi:hypothetical protein
MATPNITGNVIARGFNCFVRVGTNASDAQNVAFVTSFQATEDFQVQEATVIGNLGPISLDPQGYTCNITCAGYIPAKGITGGAIQYEDGGKISLMDIMPSRSKFMDEVSLESKIAYLDFYNKKQGKVLCSFTGVIFTSNGISGEGSQYVRHNVQLRALEWNKN